MTTALWGQMDAWKWSPPWFEASKFGRTPQSQQGNHDLGVFPSLLQIRHYLSRCRVATGRLDVAICEKRQGWDARRRSTVEQQASEHLGGSRDADSMRHLVIAQAAKALSHMLAMATP